MKITPEIYARWRDSYLGDCTEQLEMKMARLEAGRIRRHLFGAAFIAVKSIKDSPFRGHSGSTDLNNLISTPLDPKVPLHSPAGPREDRGPNCLAREAIIRVAMERLAAVLMIALTARWSSCSLR